MIEQLATAAHESEYTRGMMWGSVIGTFAGVMLGLFVAALLHAAAGKAPKPGTPIMRFTRRAGR